MNKEIFLNVTIILLANSILFSQSIVTTVHNLSVSGPGTVKANTETEICLFCHTPHNSSPAAPLWNREDPGSTYILYNSSTLQAMPGQPDGASILCLSCHDGTIALGNVISRPVDIDFSPISTMPPGTSNLATDLSNDHPISFSYTSALATVDGQLKDPTNITPPVYLLNGKLQCVSCHDPHKNIYSDFLVASSQYSSICNSCHQRTNWTSGTHNTSNHTWNGVSPDPWFHTPWTTVAQNACENCHNPHNSNGNPMLMNFLPEENNCLDCHNGNAASKNISAQFAKTYKHNITNYLHIHDANEPSYISTMHVECIDCHNPHASNAATATAPNVNGFLLGVKGVSQAGVGVYPAQYAYEICYRCHAGSPGSPPAPTPRKISQNNVRLEFATTNPSHHAVVGQGANPNVPSLIAPYTTSSIIYCTDCHASDGTGSPKGPHGSIYPRILKRQYITADNTNESATVYALCYGCHNRTSIITEGGPFKYHKKHIIDEDTPCNACHDPHGISHTQGNSINNSNLINFWTTIVTNSSSGQLKFEDQGLYRGRCYLTCHGENHNPLSYSP